jgi:hypothetical protein
MAMELTFHIESDEVSPAFGIYKKDFFALGKYTSHETRASFLLIVTTRFSF